MALRYVIGLTALLACGGTQSDEGNTTTTVERMGAQDEPPTLEASRAKVGEMSTLYASLGDGVDQAGDNCDAVARSIRSWSVSNNDRVVKLSAELDAMPKDHVNQLAPVLEAAMRRAVLQVKDGNDRCPGHQGVFDAISGLPR